ncbi:GAF domain-containing protein [Nocardioides sp. SYSU D00038]|uniref:GAF domain-containing protein n=1 Tax=Nocardioides sp. SYSU D00038 TaxID=2812554 RepID=UPI0027DD3601|nr:GAF domain-containing protein [Nocardioides sp. SYSU D00038]
MWHPIDEEQPRVGVAVAHFRAPMRSRDDAVDAHRAVERALRLGLVGMGGRLAVPPRDADEALDATCREHGLRVARRLRRFMEVPLGSVVWTLYEGTFHHGLVTGWWHHDGAEAAREVDLVHVRPCRWETATEVPDAVLASFGRGGRNFQRIRAL